MNEHNLSVREIEESDIPLIAGYWQQSTPEHLLGMGVDLAKVPSHAAFINMLQEQLSLPIPEKQSFCMIWLIDGIPSGHSNINKIIFGEEAYMHLHVWHDAARKKGAGATLVKMTIPHFFKNYQLKKLYCEPYALNPAPNKTLKKLGFRFVKKHITIPGALNFEQLVHLWEISAEDLIR